jgi:hypothetical protein
MNADTRKFAAKLLCDRKAWKALKKPRRPLKDKSTHELRADGVHEAVRRERKLKTRGQALALVGAELRHRLRETG